MCNLLLMNNQGRLFKWRTFSVPSNQAPLIFCNSLTLLFLTSFPKLYWRDAKIVLDVLTEE